MKYEDLDSVKHLEDQIENFKSLIAFLKLLNEPSVAHNQILEIEKRIGGIEQQLKLIKTTPQDFNNYFSDSGWIVYDSLSQNMMEKAIYNFKTKSFSDGEKIILEYYRPENIQLQFVRLKAVPQILSRFKFIEYAIDDYKKERYYAVILVLLTMIDGIVNDIAGSGFHSEKTELDVWDSIVTIENGIEKIRDIFKKGRNKTRNEIIDLPYRNGILHGMDLGYDNYKVAAKCWHFLFVIRDWALSKSTEDRRKEQFIEENKTKSFKELSYELKEIEKINQAIKKWKPRKISKSYIRKINSKKIFDKKYPETLALHFLELWEKRNYGHISKLYSSMFSIVPDNMLLVKDQFKTQILNKYQISDIDDQAAGITEINVEVIVNKIENKLYNIRLIFEGADNYATPRILGNGQWRIIWVEERSRNSK